MWTSSYKQSTGIWRQILGPSLVATLLLLAPAAISGPLEDATAAFERAQYATAIRILKGFSPKSANASFLLGRAYFQVGNFDAAAKSLESAVARSVGQSQYHDWLGRAYGMQAENANPFSALGLARKARDQFEKAVSLDKANLEAVSDLFSFYMAAPGFLGGGTDKAATLAATVETVDRAEFAGMQAQLAEKRKDYAEAGRLYKKAATLSPESIGRRIDLAKFYTRRGLFPQADAALADARKLHPGAPRLLFDEANLLIRSERNSQRAAALLAKYQSASRTPDDPSPYDVEQLIEKLEKLKK